jgi:hypothetical protein
MKNVGAETARYLVFEFHAPGIEVFLAQVPILRKLLRPPVRLAKRLARPIWHRVRDQFFGGGRGEA